MDHHRQHQRVRASTCHDQHERQRSNYFQHRQTCRGHLIRADGVAEDGGVEGDRPASLEIPAPGRVPSSSDLLLPYRLSKHPGLVLPFSVA